MLTIVMQRPAKTSVKLMEKILRLIEETNQVKIEKLSGQIGRLARAIELQIKILKTRGYTNE